MPLGLLLCQTFCITTAYTISPSLTQTLEQLQAQQFIFYMLHFTLYILGVNYLTHITHSILFYLTKYTYDTSSLSLLLADPLSPR